jgi:NAD(P)H dehydrogenase (quinone)
MTLRHLNFSSPDMDTVKVLIAFYSRNGSTEALAKAIAEGAQAEGAEVTLRRAREVVSAEIMQKAEGWLENAERMNALYEAPTSADAEGSDAIIFGTPTRFGNVSSELKAYIDSLGGTHLPRQTM